jgi:hypothetical protein
LVATIGFRISDFRGAPLVLPSVVTTGKDQPRGTGQVVWSLVRLGWERKKGWAGWLGRFFSFFYLFKNSLHLELDFEIRERER